MNPQPDRTLAPTVAADEQVPGSAGFVESQWLAELEEDRRLERELLEAELGGEG